MKDLPEIAPEIRALLEEVVQDPRSSIRLAPRRALRSWFETSETVRAREVSATSAERHLIEAHREALASLLCEASRIAYWKAPSMSLRPMDNDGKLYRSEQDEERWSRIARRKSERSTESGSVELLQRCLSGIKSEDGHALAVASLALVPLDTARLCLGCHAMSGSPRWALSVLLRIAAETSYEETRSLALSEAAALLARLDRLQEAKQRYVECRESWPRALFPLFNLACITGNIAEAEDCSLELDRLSLAGSEAESEACLLIRSWVQSRPRAEILTAKRVVAAVADRLSEPARKIGLVYE